MSLHINRNLNDSQLALLDKLREESRAQESFEITEKRLVDNGFDLKCFYGMCNLIISLAVSTFHFLFVFLKEQKSLLN